MKNIIVTGGAGFIGSAVIRYLIDHTDYQVLNLDKLTYAGNLDSVASVADSERYRFVQADIYGKQVRDDIFVDFRPDIIMRLVTESHVGRSIDGFADFMQTNILGTYHLLETARSYWSMFSEEYTTAVTRPKNSVLSSDKIFEIFRIKASSWSTNIDDLVRGMLSR
ncbi:GDP-mannose 4,6-dehydratase [Aliamphritea ceti]|uniref:GDP-mannose 4,6-dehydratase n=1 Tax=Aliamphritea ceti TaxID=1524258 RepID=UPI0030143E27